MSSKKYVVPLAILALAVLMPKASFAAFVSVSRSTETAGVSFSGAGVVSINPFISTAGNASVAGSSLTWSGVTIGSTQWKLSNQMIVLQSTITASNGGVQIYTDNTGSQGSAGAFTYTGSTTTDPAGLVNSSNTGAAPLTMAWAITPSTTVVPGAIDPNAGTGSSFQWFFFKDQKTPSLSGNPAFSNGEDYVRVLDYRGAHEFTGPEGPNPGTVFAGGSNQQFFPVGSASTTDIFIETNFANAATPATYGTNTLRLEAFTE